MRFRGCLIQPCEIAVKVILRRVLGIARWGGFDLDLIVKVQHGGSLCQICRRRGLFDWPLQIGDALDLAVAGRLRWAALFAKLPVDPVAEQLVEKRKKRHA